MNREDKFSFDINEKEELWIVKNAKSYETIYQSNANACKSIHEKLSAKNYELSAVETGGLLGMVQEQITDLKFRIQAYEKLSSQDATKYITYKVRARETLEMLSSLRTKLVSSTPINTGENKDVVQQQA